MKTHPTRHLQTAKHDSAATARWNKCLDACSQGDSPLNVMFVYEDTETREWSNEHYERLVKLTGRSHVRPTWWKLNNLSAPGVLAAAVSTAMRAEVIVVSVRAGGGLPLPFYTWVNNWLPYRLLRSGLLIALVGSSEKPGERSGTVGDYLRAVAGQGRLEFLVEKRKLAAEPENRLTYKISPRSAPSLRALNGHPRMAPYPKLAARS